MSVRRVYVATRLLATFAAAAFLNACSGGGSFNIANSQQADPATNDYRIDWERSDLVNGLMPAQFTLPDDNHTYDLSGQTEPLMAILRVLKANRMPLASLLDLRSASPVLSTGPIRAAWCAR